MVWLIKICVVECYKFLLLSLENIFDSKEVCFGSLICRELMKVVELFIYVIM